jgi:hypothetical protein
MTLFDKLSKEHQSLVINYPYNAIKKLILVALSKKYVMELTIGEASDIHRCLKPMAYLDINNLYEFFEK